MPANGLEAQPQDLVMTFLGAYVVPHERPVWSGGLVTLLGEFGFSTGASRGALARMVRRGGLERLRNGRLVSYRPTPRTVALLEEGDRRIFSLGREPHRAELWTALWHAIPEARRLERGRLARRLRFLGFGSVQDGMWISPHDREREVVALVDELQVGGYAGVMVGRPAAALDFRALVRGPGTSMRWTSATAPSWRSSLRPRTPAGGVGWTSARRSCCARGSYTSSAGFRLSTRSCRTS